MHLSTVLNTNVNEQRYIIEVNNGAKVNMKGFTTTGTAGTNCDLFIIGNIFIVSPGVATLLQIL